MRFLIFAAILAIPAATPAAMPVKQPGDQQCRRDGLHQAHKSAPPAARRLGDLPPGNLELAVLREVDGCHEPVIVRYGVGGEGAPSRR